MPVIQILRRLRQEAHDFQASLGYTARPCRKKEGRKKEGKKRRNWFIWVLISSSSS
jgi:hypothetical protein